MARIRMLRDDIQRLPLAARHLSFDPALSERMREERRPDRAQYGTVAWQRLRWAILVRDDFTCCLCGFQHDLARLCREMKAIGREDLIKGKAPNLVADHRLAHRGDMALFWDEGNLQCLCRRCHDTVKQREERSGGR